MGTGSEVRELRLAEEQPCGLTHIVVQGEHRKSIVRDCFTQGLDAGAVRAVSTWPTATSTVPLSPCPRGQAGSTHLPAAPHCQGGIGIGT